MPVASTLLAIKSLALTLANLSAKFNGSAEWPSMLDKTIDLYTNMSGTSPEAAAEAYTYIFPGTLWCGQGSKAKAFDELGTFRGPDLCCRDHDHCPDYIFGQATRHGLHNDRKIAALLCACDHRFLQCLRADGSVVAREVGRLYFDFLDPVCYTYDYPVKRCKRRDRGDRARRCVEYEYDTSRPPEWHFEDFPYFYGSYKVEDEVDVASETAAALAGQEDPEAAANGEDAELWNALLMDRHVRFGSFFGPGLAERIQAQDVLLGSHGWGGVIGKQVYSASDGDDDEDEDGDDDGEDGERQRGRPRR